MNSEGRSPQGRDVSLSRPAFEAAQRRAAPSVADFVNQYVRFNQMLVDRVNQMVVDAIEPVVTREKKPRREECGDPCRHDDCACRCCVGDADLVVYARLGEVRIVPVVIVNERRREREINLQLSGWTARGGKQTAIQAEILPATQFTMASCTEKEFLLRIDARQIDPNQPEGSAAERFPDVDECRPVYADLRVEGCDIRPVRIALVLLPRDCDPYHIHCRCTCC